MCIAIFKSKGSTISKETLQRCFIANPDGAGYMYGTGTGIKIRKGFFTFESFWKAYEKEADVAMLIHFRIKTHGAIEVKNCHPFHITKDIGFIHNGVISKHGTNTDVSDTRDFNEKVLQPLVKSFGTTIIFAPQIKPLIESYIGYSKLAFLDKDSNFKIYNDQMGNWQDGVWYSNFSWKEYIAPVYTSSYNTKPHHHKVSQIIKKVETYIPKDYKGEEFCFNRNYRSFEKYDSGIITKTNSQYLVDVVMDNDTVLTNVPISFCTIYSDTYGNYEDKLTKQYDWM